MEESYVPERVKNPECTEHSRATLFQGPLYGIDISKDRRDTDLQVDDLQHVLDVFAALHSYAKDMADLTTHRSWRSACGHIKHACRKSEKLLEDLEAHVRLEVPEELDSNISRSVACTRPTDMTYQSHQQPALAGSATEVTWSGADETGTQGTAEASILKQALEHKLLELQILHKNQKHPHIYKTLYQLGILSQEAGDFDQAKLYYEESLQMKRSLHGDMHHPDIAATLHSLGILSEVAGDFEQVN